MAQMRVFFRREAFAEGGPILRSAERGGGSYSYQGKPLGKDDEGPFALFEDEGEVPYDLKPFVSHATLFAVFAAEPVRERGRYVNASAKGVLDFQDASRRQYELRATARKQSHLWEMLRLIRLGQIKPYELYGGKLPEILGLEAEIAQLRKNFDDEANDRDRLIAEARRTIHYIVSAVGRIQEEHWFGRFFGRRGRVSRMFFSLDALRPFFTSHAEPNVVLAELMGREYWASRRQQVEMFVVRTERKRWWSA